MDCSAVPVGAVMMGFVLHPGGASPAECVQLGDGVLEAACRSAAATQRAISALSESVADIAPDDPRHAAAYAAMEHLMPTWLEQVAEVCRLPAVGLRGFQAKSEALEQLVDRDDDGTVHGGPALRVAASLARDILQS